MSQVCLYEILNRGKDLFSSDFKFIDLKKIFQKIRGIKVSNQKIEASFNLDNLNDDDNCIWNNLVFYVYDISKFPLTIKNKFYEKEIYVKANYDIQTIKKDIYKKTGIPTDRQIFRNKHKILSDDVILKDEKLHKINFSFLSSSFAYDSNLRIEYPDSKIKTIKTDIVKAGLELLQEIENKTFEALSDITYNIKYKDKFLPLNDLLTQYGVKNGDLLKLEKRSVKFNISIKTVTHKITKTTVSPKDTIYMIKLFIKLNEGTPMEQIRLIFGGIQLEDHKTIESYGIQNDSIIHMVLRIRG